MAQVDTSIFGQFLRAPKSVDDYTAEADTKEANRLQLLLQRGAVGDKMQAQERQRGLLRLMQGLPATATDDDRISALKGGAYFGEADALQKGALERQKTGADVAKANAEAEKQRFATAIDRQAQIAQAAGAATDQASWERGIDTVAALGVDVSKIPRQFDPQLAATLSKQAMTGAQQLEQVWKQKGYDLDVAKADEVKRNNLATDATSRANNANTVSASRENAAAVRATADATRAAANTQRDRETEMKLADDYRAQSKEFAQSKSAHEQLTSTLSSATTSPAATLAAATKFMKILDPGSVVRESELGMALAASGVLDRAANYLSTLQSGKKLTATQAADFKKISDQMFNAAQRVQQDIDKDYQGKAKTYGLRPEMVTQDLGQNSKTTSWKDLK